MIDGLLGKMLKLMGLLLIIGWSYGAITFAMKVWWAPTFFCSLGAVVTAAVLTFVWGEWYESAQSALNGRNRSAIRGRPISMGVGMLAICTTAFLVAIAMWGAKLEDYVAAFWFMVFAMIPGIGGSIIWAYYDVTNIKAVAAKPDSSQS